MCWAKVWCIIEFRKTYCNFSHTSFSYTRIHRIVRTNIYILNGFGVRKPISKNRQSFLCQAMAYIEIETATNRTEMCWFRIFSFSVWINQPEMIHCMVDDHWQKLAHEFNSFIAHTEQNESTKKVSFSKKRNVQQQWTKTSRNIATTNPNELVLDYET